MSRAATESAQTKPSTRWKSNFGEIDELHISSTLSHTLSSRSMLAHSTYQSTGSRSCTSTAVSLCFPSRRQPVSRLAKVSPTLVAHLFAWLPHSAALGHARFALLSMRSEFFHPRNLPRSTALREAQRRFRSRDFPFRITYRRTADNGRAPVLSNMERREVPTAAHHCRGLLPTGPVSTADSDSLAYTALWYLRV